MKYVSKEIKRLSNHALQGFNSYNNIQGYSYNGSNQDDRAQSYGYNGMDVQGKNWNIGGILLPPTLYHKTICW